jgi:hypothetical protein
VGAGAQGVRFEPTPVAQALEEHTGGRRSLARTPLQQAQPWTFQDFLKEVDLQFLDHMRRGTSINFADLASDPPPATLQARALPPCEFGFSLSPPINSSCVLNRSPLPPCCALPTHALPCQINHTTFGSISV